jgi:hypothetical protein
MVLIPLKSASGVEEWVTFELQGDIECFNQDKEGEVFKIGTVGLSNTVCNCFDTLCLFTFDL